MQSERIVAAKNEQQQDQAACNKYLEKWHNVEVRLLTGSLKTRFTTINMRLVINAYFISNVIIKLSTQHLDIISAYNPPTERFIWPSGLEIRNPTCIVGDFNSHSTSWGYDQTSDGEQIEQWTVNMNLLSPV